MHSATIYINPVFPDAIGFTTAAGLPGDVRFNFKDIAGRVYPNVIALNPQMVLRPFTSNAIYGYDITIDDLTGGSGLAVVPGSVMTDRYSVEVYTRDDEDRPQDMIACGRIDLTGYGYNQYGPLAPATYSTGPAGPAGPMGPRGMQGEQGVRGSRWYTGPGLPTLPAEGRIDGDMYLDESTGDVWRWDAGTGTWTAFRGTGA